MRYRSRAPSTTGPNPGSVSSRRSSERFTTRASATIAPLAVSSAASATDPAGRPSTSWVSMPWRKLSRSGPMTRTTSRGGGVEEGGTGPQGTVLVPARDPVDHLPALQLAEGGAQGDMSRMEEERNHGSAAI